MILFLVEMAKGLSLFQLHWQILYNWEVQEECWMKLLFYQLHCNRWLYIASFPPYPKLANFVFMANTGFFWNDFWVFENATVMFYCFFGVSVKPEAGINLMGHVLNSFDFSFRKSLSTFQVILGRHRSCNPQNLLGCLISLQLRLHFHCFLKMYNSQNRLPISRLLVLL